MELVDILQIFVRYSSVIFNLCFYFYFRLELAEDGQDRETHGCKFHIVYYGNILIQGRMQYERE